MYVLEVSSTIPYEETKNKYMRPLLTHIAIKWMLIALSDNLMRSIWLHTEIFYFWLHTSNAGLLESFLTSKQSQLNLFEIRDLICDASSSLLHRPEQTAAVCWCLELWDRYGRRGRIKSDWDTQGSCRHRHAVKQQDVNSSNLRCNLKNGYKHLPGGRHPVSKLIC